ncbi:hypothetical protein ACJ70E_10465 [Pseudomonas plecoglossicida]|uniref:hypothetical protein n=1 Tax=Pseudomonas plecoglossicida TaxID=70775 RepID=UPI0039773330
MEKITQFAHDDVGFNDSLPRLSTEKLELLLPTNFPDRKDFISFYSYWNGAYFDGGAYI